MYYVRLCHSAEPESASVPADTNKDPKTEIPSIETTESAESAKTEVGVVATEEEEEEGGGEEREQKEAEAEAEKETDPTEPQAQEASIGTYVCV